MLNELELLGEQLSRDIVELQQNASLKSSQLEEARRKLHREITEQRKIQNCLDQNEKTMGGLKKELEHSLKAHAKLQDENEKYRELIAKLQSQNDSYVRERQLLMDTCHAAVTEASNLQSKVDDLQFKLEEHEIYKKRYEKLQSDTKFVIDQILSGLDRLKAEQKSLENSVKEGLIFNKKLSEELNLQALFLKEANITRITMENELLRLIGVLEDERFEKRKLLQSISERGSRENYLIEWKSAQEGTRKKINFLTEENKRLLNEVEVLRAQVGMPTKNL